MISHHSWFCHRNHAKIVTAAGIILQRPFYGYYVGCGFFKQLILGSAHFLVMSWLSIIKCLFHECMKPSKLSSTTSLRLQNGCLVGRKDMMNSAANLWSPTTRDSGGGFSWKCFRMLYYGYNLGQNGWKIKTTPPSTSVMENMARFRCNASTSLNWGNGCFYTVNQKDLF